MLRKNVLILIAFGVLLNLSLEATKPVLAQNQSSEIPDKPIYERNMGNGRKFEIDSTGGGVRFQNGIRVGIERIPTEPTIERRGNTTIVERDPRNTGIGLNYRL
ncbi:MAG: hypothetical protein AAFQ14_02870 [Cyanobacteria bacterium J06621_12]